MCFFTESPEKTKLRNLMNECRQANMMQDMRRCVSIMCEMETICMDMGELTHAARLRSDRMKVCQLMGYPIQ
jgi:hypothetical protein